MNRKCPECKGCMDYVFYAQHLFLYCDLCRKYYRLLPGPNMIYIEDVEGYLREILGLQFDTLEEIRRLV